MTNPNTVQCALVASRIGVQAAADRFGISTRTVYRALRVTGLSAPKDSYSPSDRIHLATGHLERAVALLEGLPKHELSVTAASTITQLNHVVAGTTAVLKDPWPTLDINGVPHYYTSANTDGVRIAVPRTPQTETEQ